MPYLAALLAGLALSAADHPLRWWPLQFVAFLPFVWGLAHTASARCRALLGGLFAIAYAGPLLASVGFAPPILVTVAANCVQWVVVAVVGGRWLDRGHVRGPLAFAAAVTGVELLIWHFVPMFGTAQCFVRPLSAAPALVGFVAWTGVAGLVFVLVAVQALVVAAGRGGGRTPLVVAATMLAAIAALDWVRWTRPLGPSVRAAAFGFAYATADPNRRPTAVDMLGAAKAAGATLLVTPETGVWVGDRAADLALIAGQVREHGIAAAFGVWHAPTNDNRIWFFAPDGTLLTEYRKTHLIPWLEDYVAGDGTLATAEHLGHSLGGMICQDDNFSDVARAYGRRGTRLLAVPTNDWDEIREYHLENGVFRALENGYAVVRAASNGISALISPRGEVLARLDHVQSSTNTLVGELPVGDGVTTVYANRGDWPMAVLVLACLLAANRRRILA